MIPGATTVADAVLNFFESRGGLPGATREEKLCCAYLDEQIVDSMGIIEMVSHFEETFNIRFEADHLQSLEFQTEPFQFWTFLQRQRFSQVGTQENEIRVGQQVVNVPFVAGTKIIDANDLRAFD